MIKTFGDKETERFANGERISRFDAFRGQAEKRLRILEAATCLNDLTALPSNRLEGLKGNRKWQYSIRINQQWRLCFEWPENNADGAYNVSIIDYH